ncbi:type II secretion system F family protein [Candidatus Margulisiibacteriota bacterium]
MLDSGVNLFDALKLSCGNWSFCEDILNSIAQGNSLSESLSKLPFVVNDTVIDFVRVSEQRGDLSGGLKRASFFLENKDRFRKKLIGALSYPAFIVMVSFVALFILISVLLPSFSTIYADAGIELPLISMAAIRFGEFIFNNLHFIFIFFLCSALALFRYSRTDKGRLFVDHVLFRLPLIGKIRREMILSRFFDNFCQAVKAGISVTDALFMSGSVLGSPIYKESIMESVSMVRSGAKLSHSLNSRLFPSLALSLIAVGESSAKLDMVFGELKSYFEEIAESKVKLFSGLIEPISTLVVGAVVGIIVFAMFMPMIKLMSTMSF